MFHSQPLRSASPLAALPLLLLFLPAAASAAAPAAPTNLTATVQSESQLTLSWSDNSADETAFEIQYRAGVSGNFSSIGNIAANLSTQVITGTTGGIVYQFQICAVGTGTPVEKSAFAGPVTVLTAYPFYSGVTGKEFKYLQNGTLIPYTLATTSSSAATSYAVAALPPGLNLDSTTGVISGTPTGSGLVESTVTMTFPGNITASTPLSLRVFKPAPGLAAPVISTAIPSQDLVQGQGVRTLSLTSYITDPDAPSAARMVTDLGTMDFAFYQQNAPQTVANFMGYADRGDFTNTIFHRTVSGFIVQGGAFHADATASAVTTKPPVVNEPDISNIRGTVAMAKVGGNPDSATNQFFVNLADNATNLNNQNEGFTVFARVAGNGMTVADAIAALPTRNYAAVNGALGTTPVKTSAAPTTYDIASLVRISSVTSVPPLSFTAASANPAIATVNLNGSSLTITPIAVGDTTVNITATDLDSQTAVASFPVSVFTKDNYQTWAARQNFPSPADAAASADPDGDGRLNFVEFALGSQPLVTVQADPVPGLENGSPTLNFSLRLNTTGVAVTLQKATDLNGPWADQWTSSEGLTGPWISGTSFGPDTVSVTAKDPNPPAAGGREFLRLKITQ